MVQIVMKKDIHPSYYPKAKITCSCGNVFELGSSTETMEIETCSSCHPFYTGQERSSDRVGQVQKFKKRLSAQANFAAKKRST